MSVLFWSLVFIHWLIVINNSFYIFIRKNDTYDLLYFTILCITVASWTITKTECVISYLEKKCLDNNYVYQSNTDLPFVSSIFGKKLQDYILFFSGICKIYGVYVMLTLYKTVFPIKITFIYFIIYMMIKDKFF
jgi:hypothetical protein